MILVLSGEGPTDIGTRKPTEAGWKFVPGPMAWIVDKLIERRNGLGYSLIDHHANGGDCISFLSEGDLAEMRRSAPVVLPRFSHGVNQHFRKAAIILGKHADQIAEAAGAPAIAVLFCDSDGTRSTPATEWQEKFDSIRNGFEVAGFAAGVPMVPRPKSEAWMLCGLLKRENPNRDCGWLEDESGNDASPNSLKKQLAAHLGHDPTAEEQADFAREGRVDPELIDLQSFIAFREELARACGKALRSI